MVRAGFKKAQSPVRGVPKRPHALPPSLALFPAKMTPYAGSEAAIGGMASFCRNFDLHLIGHIGTKFCPSRNFTFTALHQKS